MLSLLLLLGGGERERERAAFLNEGEMERSLPAGGQHPRGKSASGEWGTLAPHSAGHSQRHQPLQAPALVTTTSLGSSPPGILSFLREGQARLQLRAPLCQPGRCGPQPLGRGGSSPARSAGEVPGLGHQLWGPGRAAAGDSQSLAMCPIIHLLLVERGPRRSSPRGTGI